MGKRFALGNNLLIEVDKTIKKDEIELLNNKKTRPAAGTIVSIGPLVEDSRLEEGMRIEFNPNTGKETENGLLIQNYHNCYCGLEN